MSLTDPQEVSVLPAEESEEKRAPLVQGSIVLTEQQRRDLEAWIDGHLRQIAHDLQPIHRRLQQERDQFAGKMPGGDYPYAGAFRINYPLTRKKVRELANRIKQAYLDADPIWGISIDDPALFQVATKIEKALDTGIDHELNEEDDLARCLFEATLHGTGVLVPTWTYHEESMRRHHRWDGFDGKTLSSLQGLLEFESTYPNWREAPELVRLHTQLRRGQTVERDIYATIPVVNHPDFQHVELERVLVSPSVEGYEGLRTTPCYGRVVSYTRFELLQLAEQDVLDAEALSQLLGSAPGRDPDEHDDPERQWEPFECFQGTIRYALSRGDPPRRYHVWFAMKDRLLLRLREYPWSYAEADLVPFYVRMEIPGFFKEGLAADVVDEHTTLNVLLNLYLNAIDMANSMRWKAKYRSIGYAYLLSKRWSPHLPAPWKDDPNEVQSNVTPTNHLAPIVTGFELLRRQADESTGTTSLQSGRESPTDPRAPATKTIALLQQIQPNEKDVLRSLEPAFRQMGRWTLWLYAQGLQEGWIDSLPGGLRISPDFLLSLLPSLHPRATLYEVDRQGRFQRDVELLGLTQKIIGTSRPDVILKMLRLVISQADSQWGRIVDTLNLEEATPTLPSTEPVGTPADGSNGRPSPTPDAQMNRLAAHLFP